MFEDDLPEPTREGGWFIQVGKISIRLQKRLFGHLFRQMEIAAKGVVPLAPHKSHRPGRGYRERTNHNPCLI
jgi:hypothetical protein